MTEAILKTLPSQITSGFPWLKAPKDLPPSALRSNILCKRHNSMLSMFDECGLSVHNALVARILREKPARRKLVVSGHDFERWLLQRLCAVVYSESAARGGKRLQDYTIDIEAVIKAMFQNQWGPAAGLYVTRSRPEFVREGVEQAPILDPERHEIIGTRITLCGVAFELVLKKSENLALPFDEEATMFRPRWLRFPWLRPILEIKFSWLAGASPNKPMNYLPTVGAYKRRMRP